MSFFHLLSYERKQKEQNICKNNIIYLSRYPLQQVCKLAKKFSYTLMGKCLKKWNFLSKQDILRWSLRESVWIRHCSIHNFCFWRKFSRPIHVMLIKSFDFCQPQSQMCTVASWPKRVLNFCSTQFMNSPLWSSWTPPPSGPANENIGSSCLKVIIKIFFLISTPLTYFIKKSKQILSIDLAPYFLTLRFRYANLLIC